MKDVNSSAKKDVIVYGLRKFIIEVVLNKKRELKTFL